MECRRDMHTGFWWGTLKGKTHLKDLSLDRCVGKNKRHLKETGLGGGGICMPQDGDKWWAFVNMEINF
jgi:hypothetical protein